MNETMKNIFYCFYCFYWFCWVIGLLLGYYWVIVFVTLLPLVPFFKPEALYFFLAMIFLAAGGTAMGAEDAVLCRGASSSSSESSTSTSWEAAAEEGTLSSSCDWNLDGAVMRLCSSSSRVMWHLPRRDGLGFRTACTKRQVTPKLPPANHRPPHVMMSAASEPLTMRSLGDLPSLLGNNALLLES